MFNPVGDDERSKKIIHGIAGNNPGDSPPPKEFPMTRYRRAGAPNDPVRQLELWQAPQVAAPEEVWPLATFQGLGFKTILFHYPISSVLDEVDHRLAAGDGSFGQMFGRTIAYSEVFVTTKPGWYQGMTGRLVLHSFIRLLIHSIVRDRCARCGGCGGRLLPEFGV